MKKRLFILTVILYVAMIGVACAYTWPTNTRSISSGFGERWGAMHHGVDITANYEPCYAIASGTVFGVFNEDGNIIRHDGNGTGYGLYLIIDIGNNTKALYGHLSEVKVQAGQRISEGQIIATTGNSGNSTGAHLHFEVRKNATDIYSYFYTSTSVDPVAFLGRSSSGGTGSTSYSFAISF